MFFASLLPQWIVYLNHSESLRNFLLEIEQTDNPKKILERKFLDIICCPYCCQAVKISISLHDSLKQGFREINVKMTELDRSSRIT